MFFSFYLTGELLSFSFHLSALSFQLLRFNLFSTCAFVYPVKSLLPLFNRGVRSCFFQIARSEATSLFTIRCWTFDLASQMLCQDMCSTCRDRARARRVFIPSLCPTLQALCSMLFALSSTLFAQSFDFLSTSRQLVEPLYLFYGSAIFPKHCQSFDQRGQVLPL